jgi:hypothetical protein
MQIEKQNEFNLLNSHLPMIRFEVHLNEEISSCKLFEKRNSETKSSFNISIEGGK